MWLSAQAADMAVGGITVSAERDEVVDFTTYFWEESSAVLVRRPASGMQTLCDAHSLFTNCM